MTPTQLQTILNYDGMRRHANIDPVLTLDERIIIHRRIANSKTPLSSKLATKLKHLTNRIQHEKYNPVTVQVDQKYSVFITVGNRKILLTPQTALNIIFPL